MMKELPRNYQLIILEYIYDIKETRTIYMNQNLKKQTHKKKKVNLALLRDANGHNPIYLLPHGLDYFFFTF